MSNIKEFLKDWIIRFIENKDLIHKKLISVQADQKGFDVVAKYNDREQFIIVDPNFKIDRILPRMQTEMNYGLVVLNMQENFKTLVEHWSKLIKFKFLCIYFVNPFSNLDKKWIIFPYTHNRICDESSLKTGLKSMFEMVEPVKEKDIETRFK